MGSILPPTQEMWIEVSVVGGGALDYVEVLHNNQAIHRWSAHECAAYSPAEPVKVFLELGWGEKSSDVDWLAELEVIVGQLLSVEPRFRGRAIVAPQSVEEEKCAFSSWERISENRVRFNTRTWGSLTTVTPETQGVCLGILGEESTQIKGRVNNREIQVALGELRHHSRAGFLGGFLRPPYRFHRAVPKTEYSCHDSTEKRYRKKRVQRASWVL